jgi:hypothetical protein
MPVFNTFVKLPSASEKDYLKLSEEMKKRSFKPSASNKASKAKEVNYVFGFNYSGKASLLDATAAVSQAAATIGKKYSFIILKEKVVREEKAIRD